MIELKEGSIDNRDVINITKEGIYITDANGNIIEPYDGKIIEVKYFTDIDHLEYIDGNKSNWIDLRAAEDVEMKAGDFKLIPLGVAMRIPNGYEAHIAPRSSTYKTWGIIETNSVGVVDQSYSGNNDQWKFPAYATRDTIIHKNDRICQFRIIENQPKIKFVEVEKLEDTDRGGFGSTGVN